MLFSTNSYRFIQIRTIRNATLNIVRNHYLRFIQTLIDVNLKELPNNFVAVPGILKTLASVTISPKRIIICKRVMKRFLRLNRVAFLGHLICGERSTNRFRQLFLWDKSDEVATHTIVDKFAAESAQIF
jgi:hypothetical protein